MAAFATHSFNLPTGELTLCLPLAVNPDDYFHVEARRNPKRGFLFVSTLLGKHLPVSVGRLRKVHIKLAERVLAQRPDADVTLVIGMAETATMLGYGVWRALDSTLAGQPGDRRAYFLQTTRYRLNQPAWAFEERHSHAPSQWLHGLDDPRLAQVTRVVLVDDELSTGQTFHALEAVLRAQLPQVKAVDWVCLTDFRPAAYLDHEAISLLQGEWAWIWHGTPEPADLAEGQAVDPAVLRADFGRAAPLDRDGREVAVRQAKAWLAGVKVQGSVLMLGTAEFMALPLELAEILAKRPGVDSVAFQATTRSPALMPATCLGPDHYGEGVEQFVYNYTRANYETVLVAVETPPSAATAALGAALGAQVIGPAA